MLSTNSIHKIKNVFRQRRWRGDVSLQSRATTLRVPSQEQDEEETSRKGTLGFLFKLAMRQEKKLQFKMAQTLGTPLPNSLSPLRY